MTSPGANLSLAIAEHVAGATYAQLPPAAVEAAKLSLLDAIGVSVAAGTLAEGCEPFAALAREQGGGDPVCTILGFGDRVSPSFAAFANGALAHALDFEDSHDEAFVHPNAALVPVLLAVAESRGGIDGQELLTALAVGCDLVCRLGLALTTRLASRGWYGPPILGGLGAAAGAARLLGLDARGVLDALSLTLGQLGSWGELAHSPESVLRSVRDAFPAQAALTGALLAQRGVRGFDRPLEGEKGLFALYAGGSPDPTALLAGLGESFEGARVSFKPWPSCRASHAFVQAALEVVTAHDIEPDAVAEIRLRGAPMLEMVAEPEAQKRRPKTAIDAKFSAYFTVAAAVCDRRVTFESFAPDRLVDPELLRIADRTRFSIDESLRNAQGALELVTASGEALAVQVEDIYGSPGNPMSRDDLLAKFRACLAHSPRPISEAQAATLAETILRLEDVADVGAALGAVLSA